MFCLLSIFSFSLSKVISYAYLSMSRYKPLNILMPHLNLWANLQIVGIFAIIGQYLQSLTVWCIDQFHLSAPPHICDALYTLYSIKAAIAWCCLLWWEVLFPLKLYFCFIQPFAASVFFGSLRNITFYHLNDATGFWSILGAFIGTQAHQNLGSLDLILSDSLICVGHWTMCKIQLCIGTIVMDLDSFKGTLSHQNLGSLKVVHIHT